MRNKVCQDKLWESRQRPRARALDDDYRVNKSRAQEERIARRIGGRRQPASGALPGLKGDVSQEQFLVEAKRTASNVLAFRMEWLSKIDDEATAAGKLPALALEFESMPAPVARDWIIIPVSVFQQLLGGQHGHNAGT